MPLPFAAKWAIGLAGSWAIGQLFGGRRETVSAQRRPNEITSSGQASYSTLFPVGEIPVAGAEVFRGVEITTSTDPPFSSESPGKGRALHLAYALAEGACESPTAVRIGDELLALSRRGAASGPTIVTTRTTTDGGVQWDIRAGRGGRGRLTWYLRADGTQGSTLRAAADRMAEDQLPWGTDHRLDGIAWVHVELYQPAHLTAEDTLVWPVSIPRFEFVVKGLKLRRTDTGAVEWTDNAADVRWWVESQLLGFPSDRIDAGSARAARVQCARQVDLDTTTALGRVRLAFRLTTTAAAPSPPTGTGFPPGGGWGVVMAEPSQSSPFAWVAFSSYDESTSSWGTWGRVRLLSRWTSGGGGGPGGGPVAAARSRSRIVLPVARDIEQATGNVEFELDVDGGDVRPPADPGLGAGGPTSRLDLGPPALSTELHSGSHRLTRAGWTLPAGSRPQVLPSLTVGGAANQLSSLAVTPNSARTFCQVDMVLGRELIPTLERSMDAVRIVRQRDGAEFRLHGPDYAENSVRDSTNPYRWTTRQSWPDFASWIGEDASGSYWLVLTEDEQSDDVVEIPPGINPGAPGSPYIPLFNIDRRFSVYGVNGLITGSDYHRASALRNELDIAWAGRTIVDGGVMHLWPGQDSPPALVLDDSTGETVYVRSAEAVSSAVNAISCTINASRVHGFGRWAMRPLVDDQAVQRDGREVQRDIGIRGFITSPAQAEALMAIQLRQARAQRVVTRRESLSSREISLRPGQRVILHDPRNGFGSVSGGPLRHQGNASGRFMRLLSRRINPRDLTIELDLVEHPGETHIPDAHRMPMLEPDVTLPGVLVPDPSGLQVSAESWAGFGGAATLRLVCTWTPVAAARTIVQWRPVVPTGGSIPVVGGDDLTATPDWGRPRETVVDGSSATIPDVRDGVAVEVRIRHVSRAGWESAWSSVVTVTASGRVHGTGAGAQNVELTAVVPTISLTWTLPPQGAPPLWRVQVGLPSAAGVSWGQAEFIDGTLTSWSTSPAGVLAAILSLTSISKRITARIQPAVRDGQSEQVGGAVVVAATVTPAVTTRTLAMPTGLQALSGDGAVQLSWGRVASAQRYRIERYASVEPNQDTWVLLTTVTAITHQDSTVSNGANYRYRVRAEADGWTVSPWSATVTGRPVATPTTAPGAPTGLLLQAGTPPQSQIDVSWTAPTAWGTGPSASRGYRVEWRRSGASVWSRATTTSTSRTLTGLAAATAYEVRVWAVTGHGETSTTTLTLTTAARTVTPPPSLSWGAWASLFPGRGNLFSPAIGDVNISSSAAEADGNIWDWGSGGALWTGRGRRTGLAASGIMGTITRRISGTLTVLQVLQSGSSNANNIRRTDTDTWLDTDFAQHLFSGDLDTRRSDDDADFVDAVLLASASSLPTIPSSRRPIGFLRWLHTPGRSDGAGEQVLAVLEPSSGAWQIRAYRRLWS